LPYHYDDPSLYAGQPACQETLYEYNQTRPSQTARRQELLREMFAEIGAGCHVETPVHANWGCRHVHLGAGSYVNSSVTFVDDADIFVGEDCLIGPNVVIATAGHPILPVLRRNHYVYTLPVRIGNNVWIGSAAQIMPGVSIGDNTVIGSGSVVTSDIPASVVALGVPCRVVREIGPHDAEFYTKGRRLDVAE